MKQFILSISILLTAITVNGQALTLTLEQYRQKVLEYNQDVKQSREAVKAAVSALKAIKTGFFPKVQIGGDYSYQFEDVEFMQGIDMKHNNYSAPQRLPRIYIPEAE